MEDAREITVEQNKKHPELQLIQGFKLCPKFLQKLHSAGALSGNDNFERLNELHLAMRRKSYEGGVGEVLQAVSPA